MQQDASSDERFGDPPHALEKSLHAGNGNVVETEDALRRSEEKFRALFDGSRDALLLLDGKRFLDCNVAASELFGFPKERLLALHPADLSPPMQPGGHNSFIKAQNFIDAAFAAGSQAFEWMHRRSDGRVFPAEVVLSRFELDGEPLLQASVRDISERKDLEREILEIGRFERKRFHRKFSKDLCRRLVEASQESAAISGRLPEISSAEAETLRQLSATLLQLGAKVRSLGGDPLPPEAIREEVSAALRDLVSYVKRVFRVDCSFKSKLFYSLNDETLASHLYLVAQEALHNAVIHGRASKIRVTLSWENNTMKLSIADNGIGLATELPPGAGTGIPIMRYRAGQIGATLTLTSNPGGGTVVDCALPVMLQNSNPRYLARLQQNNPRKLEVEKLRRLGLTRRECEVFHWLAEGKRDSEIACILSISLRTVNHHVSSILSQLNAETRTAAVVRAGDLQL